ncbi:hypothetical protein VHEMI08097 [[Torrubiella] hemipterigena]|uniref:Uncharacterized protein n=1 Tax=[Torrubiella] hemipterigena TaxID=1531966 RepID=A0A0A1TCD2_9HYPO|nr:hypothetical protein VHEMI08097 [[Torrubiella] hemipterigena]
MQFTKLAAIVLPFLSQVAALDPLPANPLVAGAIVPTPAPQNVHVVRRDTESCATSRMNELSMLDPPTPPAALHGVRPTLSCTITAPASMSSEMVSYAVAAESYLSNMFAAADKHPNPAHCGGEVNMTVSAVYCSEPSITLQFTGTRANMTATSTVIANYAKITNIRLSAGVAKAVSHGLLAGAVGAAAFMVL